jgi:hypothetical protein
VQGSRDHMSAAGGQGTRHGQADAAARAGDYGGLPGEVHVDHGFSFRSLVEDNEDQKATTSVD